MNTTIIAAVAAILIGLAGGYVGSELQKAHRVALAEERVDELEKEADRLKERHKAALLAQQRNAELVVANHMEAARRARERALRSEQIVAAQQQRNAELRDEILEIQNRFAGGSTCALDPDDIGLLNDALRAIGPDRDHAAGMP